MKPVRWVVPYAPGGSSDLLARLLGQKLAEAWGQQVIVDNRPGAAGNIGTEFAARAPADGYTLLLVASTFAMNSSVYPKLALDPVADFAPVTNVMRQPFILSVHPSLPVSSVRQLLALARQKRGQLNYSSGGSGTSGHIAAALFEMMALETSDRPRPYRCSASGLISSWNCLVMPPKFATLATPGTWLSAGTTIQRWISDSSIRLRLSDSSV